MVVFADLWWRAQLAAMSTSLPSFANRVITEPVCQWKTSAFVDVQLSCLSMLFAMVEGPSADTAKTLRLAAILDLPRICCVELSISVAR